MIPKLKDSLEDKMPRGLSMGKLQVFSPGTGGEDSGLRLQPGKFPTGKLKVGNFMACVNKPNGAFWTSSYKSKFKGSDWTDWKKKEMKRWHSGIGAVFEVQSGAKIARVANYKQYDKLVHYNDLDSSVIDAEAIVENVYITVLSNREYSLSISFTHRGEFVKNKAATLIDRDGVTLYTGTLKGIISTIDSTRGSIYISQEDDSGDLLDEDGNGLLLEQVSKGSMYEMQDIVNFTGGKLDTDTLRADTNITGLSRGGVETIFIEDGGQVYVSGDMIVFDVEAAGGNGAEAIIGSTGDELILEDALAFEQYEITAIANQTVFGGISNGAAVRDDHGNPIAINLMHGKLEVHIDGIVQAQSTYSFAPDNITFTTNPNLTGGERVEIFTDKSRLLMEDGYEVLLDGYKTTNAGAVTSTDQRLRRIKITNPGAGYEKLPSVFPGGYQYFDSITDGGLDATP